MMMILTWWHTRRHLPLTPSSVYSAPSARERRNASRCGRTCLEPRSCPRGTCGFWLAVVLCAERRDADHSMIVVSTSWPLLPASTPASAIVQHWSKTHSFRTPYTSATFKVKQHLTVLCGRYAANIYVYYYYYSVTPRCFIPGLKPSFSANPSHRSLHFLLQDWLHRFPGLFTDTSEHIRFLLFSFSVSPLFSCWFRAVD